jgi:hypothetical protein
MGMIEEAAAGVERIRETIERTGKLKISRADPLPDRRALYFAISSGDKQIDFVLSYEFLSDLPNTVEYQGFLEEYASILEKRFEQPNLLDFYSRSGTAFNIEIRWPFEAHPTRVASFVHVTVNNIRTPTLIAICAIVFFSYPGRLVNPFERQCAIVNRVRQGL